MMSALPSVEGSVSAERFHQYEGGVRYMTREFGTSVAVFYDKFSPRSAVNI